jgi:hypothetical protein
MSGDMPSDVNHISPCISPEENAENRAQNEQLRRSDDTGDICSQRCHHLDHYPILYSLEYG